MLTDIKTRYGNYKVDFLSANTYRADDSPAITAWSMEDGPIATITVCLDDSRLEPNQSYVDTNNCPWAPEWIEKNGLGRIPAREPEAVIAHIRCMSLTC